MGCSTLHIKTELECRVFLFDEEKGIATPGIYFNLEVRKGEQDLLFVSAKDETLRCQMFYNVEENDCDYRILIEKEQFKCSFEELLRLAKQGNANAQYKLGACYYSGNGVEQDYEKAVEWYLKAEKQGEWDCNANYTLAKCYEYGIGVKQNYAEAEKRYRIIADNNMYEWHHWDRIKCRIGAEQNDAESQYKLGVYYENGKGVKQDYEEAIKWYRKAAEQGYIKAQKSLGDCYHKGIGVTQDYTKAEEWYKKAKEPEKKFNEDAEKGSAETQYKMGWRYKYGEGVEEDDAVAAQWYLKAAERGNANAQYELGQCYYKGVGVEQNYSNATKWYRKAAEQGKAAAQLHLGLCYYKGCGVEENYTEAAKWFRKAAEQESWEAQINIGWCYENGYGVEQDYYEAEKWYQKASLKGYLKARDRLEEFEQKKKTQTPYYLFFDTETTGVPINYNRPARDTKNWPRLVQLGWILTDKDGIILNKGNEIVKPNGFEIPTDASMVHGITTEKARQIGKPMEDVIKLFLNDVKRAECLVGHNISFDQHVVGAELYRLGVRDVISNKQSICTMQCSTGYCKIPGLKGYKYPKLQELYYKLFGSNFEDAHDAMADITATKKCFFELKRLDEIYVDTSNFDFKNAEIVCCVKLNDFEESEFKCRQNANGDYYLLCLPSFTGLEIPFAAYASDGSGRKPNYLDDSLIIYENGDDFAAKFGNSEDDEEDNDEDFEDFEKHLWFNKK